MSSKKVHINVDARIIIDRISEISGLKQYEIASQVFDISDKNLSNKIKRNSIDFYAIIQWAGNHNVDLNWLLMGLGESRTSDTPPEDNSNDDLESFKTSANNRFTILESKIDRLLEIYDNFIEIDLDRKVSGEE